MTNTLLEVVIVSDANREYSDEILKKITEIDTKTFLYQMQGPFFVRKKHWYAYMH